MAILDCFKVYGRQVKFQNIYNHIEQKRQAAAAKNQVDKLHAKLQKLKGELWGPFKPWVKGNEGADKLASEGHTRPHILGTWTTPPLSTEVTVFDPEGCVVGGNLRCKAIKMHAKKWTECMSCKLV
jgi:hypothetical protein